MTQTVNRKTALVTGFTGQDGTFLTKLLLEKGYRVIALVRRISTEPPRRQRGQFDFSDAIANGQLILEPGDLLSRSSLDRIIKQHYPDEVYNLAAQSDVHASFKMSEHTIETDFMGVVNLIESLCANGKRSYSGGNISQKNPAWRMYQASTSEMFGQAPRDRQMDEDTPLRPVSPYGIAKTAAHHYCRMKRDQGYFISTGILFNHESEIRGGDFVTQKIIRAVVDFGVNDEGELQLGNMESRRDWGYASDYVRGMHMMLQTDAPDEYVLGTGETHSVRQFVETALDLVNKKIVWSGEGENEVGHVDGKKFVVINPYFYRPNEVGFLWGYSAKAEQQLGWKPEVDFEHMVAIMLKEEMKRRK